MNRGSWLIVALALLAGIGGLLAGHWATTSRSAPPPGTPAVDVIEPGERLPALVLPGLDGEPQSLAGFDGRPLLINYWATWCRPCIDELPRLAALHARRDGDGVAVLAIALEHDPAAVRAFVEQHDLPLPIRIEPPGPTDSSVRLGNSRSVLPYSVLIDADGRIVDTHLGELHEPDLAEWAARVRGG